ncbi:YchJ family protein [Aliidiomarina celeris]|uniref:YchJ family protein n=1 Tax=Aliidiomarina celeris TaxID=2249428 RepID=UPI000DEA8CF6|nr:YchJ family protein [Aliidiomarina celeris]
MADTEKACPCGSGQAYASCCEPLHLQQQVAQTPEQLMRSRYSAFALANAAYLMQTWHKSTRPVLKLENNPEWVKLQVLSSSAKGNQGFVHFRAFYHDGENLQMLDEKSRFVCEQGQWFYLDGDY